MNKEEHIQHLKFCAAKIFKCDEGVTFLRELEEFTRVDEAEFCSDPRKSEYLQGRRSVMLHIRKFLKGD